MRLFQDAYSHPTRAQAVELQSPISSLANPRAIRGENGVVARCLIALFGANFPADSQRFLRSKNCALPRPKDDCCESAASVEISLFGRLLPCRLQPRIDALDAGADWNSTRKMCAARIYRS
ncbi:MAG: hypothetical protein ACREQZ_10865 [Woeseiaceae bacterium]